MFTINSRRSTIVSVILLAVLVSGCARGARAQPDESRQDARTDVQHGSSARAVAVGDEFELRLDANASTGCSWVVTALDESLVELLGNDYFESANAEGRLGAGGQAVLRFRALAAGQTVIRLAYGHAWELDQATYETYELDVTVQ